MTRRQKIQAAIDALPNATGGEWGICASKTDCPGLFRKETNYFCFGPGVGTERDQAILSAAKDLAEEVVRLRGLVKAAFMESVAGYRFPQDELEEAWFESDSKSALEGGW